MAQAEFRGVPVHYESWGAGLPLVALHGGGSSGAQWQRLAAALQNGRMVIAPDLIGFGKTGAWPQAGGLTHDLQADLIAALIEQEGAVAVDVVGHSYGGATAVRLALRRPELARSLVLVEPLLATLLRDAGDPLFDEYRDMAEGFVRHARAGRDEEAWALFLDYRKRACKIVGAGFHRHAGLRQLHRQPHPPHRLWPVLAPSAGPRRTRARTSPPRFCMLSCRNTCDLV